MAGARGVKKPAALKLVEGRGPGVDSGGRAVVPPPLFRRLPPEAPEWLNGEALDEWNRVVPELQRLELTKPIDRASLTAYCLTWQRLVQAQREMDEDGSVLATNSQGRVRHPAVAVIEAASKELRAWAHEFGLTPSSESNVTSGSGNGDDENPFS